MGSQQPAYGRTEPGDQVGGLLVAMGLSQGGEQERLHYPLGLLCHAHRPHVQTTGQRSTIVAGPRELCSR
jgi:hypothetical protein